MLRRGEIFAAAGGYGFGRIQDVQARTPVESIVAAMVRYSCLAQKASIVSTGATAQRILTLAGYLSLWSLVRLLRPLPTGLRSEVL